MLRALLLAGVTAAVLATAGPAGATTFCVPAFHAACPDNGTNVVKGTVQEAATSNASDNVPDTVIIAKGTFTETGSIAPTGNDKLTIQGAGAAGPDATLLTTSASGNIIVFNEQGRASGMVVRDLRIVVPASFPDGQGAAAQTSKDSLLERVDVEVRNPGSDALSSFATGTYRDGRIYATGAGTIGRGVAPNSAQGAGPITLERLRIENTTSAVAISNVPSVPVTVRRSAIVNPSQVGVSAFGGSATVENSVIEVAGSASALSAAAYPGGASGSLTARHVTVVGSAGATGPALSSRVNGGVAGNASLTLRDSIVRGFGTTYVDPPVVDPPPVTTPIDPPITPPAKDTTKPRISSLKVVGKLSAKRGGRVRFTLSEKATVTLRFTRRGSRKVVTRTVKAKAGTVTVKVRARSLRRTKYTVSVRATDTAGNVSKTVKRTTQVGR